MAKTSSPQHGLSCQNTRSLWDPGPPWIPLYLWLSAYSGSNWLWVWQNIVFFLQEPTVQQMIPLGKQIRCNTIHFLYNDNGWKKYLGLVRMWGNQSPETLPQKLKLVTTFLGCHLVYESKAVERKWVYQHPQQSLELRSTFSFSLS